jgi:hypothetical protein
MLSTQRKENDEGDVTMSWHPFDRDKPFYPLVVGYVCQLIGCRELGVRGIFGSASINDIKASLTGIGAPTFTWSKEKLDSLHIDLNMQLGPMKLHSNFLGDSITVDIDVVANEITSVIGCLADQMIKAAENIFVLAHECSKDKPWHDQGPLWEFLRHCRNAADHGGRFHFPNDEPQRPAHWGRFEITRSLEATALFNASDETGLLSLGDPIHLLWDIEQSCAV